MTGNFALLISLAAVVYSTRAQPRWLLEGLIAAVWMVDYIARLRGEWCVLKNTPRTDTRPVPPKGAS